MTHPLPRLLVLSLTGCMAAGGQPPKTEGPDVDSPVARELLTAHNEVRAHATPAPQPPLRPLTWSEELAAKAQAWANQCHWAHNPDRGDVGENIAAAAPPDSRTDQAVVEDWASEVADYTYATNQCAPGEVCGHYTQLVWRDTTQVGCATALCEENSPFGAQLPRWRFWVCNYSPPGNIVGQRPY
jgi:pathogenesis-related protein 1